MYDLCLQGTRVASEERVGTQVDSIQAVAVMKIR